MWSLQKLLRKNVGIGLRYPDLMENMVHGQSWYNVNIFSCHMKVEIHTRNGYKISLLHSDSSSNACKWICYAYGLFSLFSTNLFFSTDLLTRNILAKCFCQFLKCYRLCNKRVHAVFITFSNTFS